ncbi:MAG: prephenate dehydrogenase/arogenate dehydrogenase family protein [Nitrososphaera sp.]|uniref:prephenate dehydrogenase/arogenate dehydrogenase family protein n=1 Tax=Candidatus Nitrososphaera gargensis TaxID=497727 RepID=UPI0011E509F2|nr:prephenate dehydrogenase/arogenate dehydrogenase family protein [Candidatus Nitrososphaera gargensis]
MQEIAIVGAAGKMGSWFTNYFARRGLHVSVYDVNKETLRPSGNVRVASGISACVKGADLVLVSVPVRMTPQIIRECAKSMKNDGAIISEISSVKHRTFQALRRVPGHLRPLCIHPMFGPGASDKMQTKVLLVPVRNEEAELKIVHEMFENAAVKVLPDARTHDKAIATVLGLTYFANIVFAKVVSGNNISMLKQVSGTTFGLQSLIAESILTNEPDLVIALIQENPYAKKYIQQYLKKAAVVAKMASARDSKRLRADLKKVRSKMQKWQDLQQSYRRMYDIIENMK